MINFIYYPSGVSHDNYRYQSSPNYKVRQMPIAKDDKIFQFIDKILRVDKADTSRIDVWAGRW